MSEYAKRRLLRTLIDLREEAAKCHRACEADRDPGSTVSANWRGYAEGLDFAVSEIVAVLEIDAEEEWTSQVDQASADVFGGGQ
jgi:hypothetical protein